jgi:integrase
MRKKNFIPKVKEVEEITVKANDHAGDLSKMWYVYWRQNGKPQKKYGKLAHIMDVDARRAALKQLREEWQERVGRLTPDKSVIAQIYELLATRNREKGWRKKGYATTKSRVNMLVKFLAGRELSKVLLAEFFSNLKANMHPRTYNGYVTYLTSYLNDIGKPELVPDGLEVIPKARKKSKPAKWLQKHEMKLLKRTISGENERLWLAVRLMYNCAIRPGELRLLQAKHFLLDLKLVYIPPEISKTEIERFVPILPVLLPDLAFLRQYSPEQYLFPSPRNPKKPIGKNYFGKKIRAIMDELEFGREYKPCYSFRNTAAMEAVRDGADVREVSQWMGHSSFNQTMEYLRQLGHNDLDRFVSKVKGL